MTARHVARKRFGQHFLADPAVIAAIVGEIDPRPGEHLVEIGPGLGALTNPVVQRAGRLTVIELDRDLAARLRQRPELRVIEADALKTDFAAIAAEAGGKLRLIGNLPYNISTPLLFHLLDAAEIVADQHFMLQKEVIARMVAAPGGKDYGRLSVVLQWRYAMESVLDVPPEAFDPPPRVDSAVVRMRPRADPAPLQRSTLESIVALAFSQRRKILRHTLGPLLARQLPGHPFDLQRRAEEISVAEYVTLAQKMGSESIFPPEN